MGPNEVRTMSDSSIVEMLVSLKPADDAVAWLASVIADPVKVAGVHELSRRFTAERDGRSPMSRASSASTVYIDGDKFKRLMWRNRIPLVAIGPQIGMSAGLASVLAHKGRMSYWTADAIATKVLSMHVDEFLLAVGTPEELARMSA